MLALALLLAAGALASDAKPSPPTAAQASPPPLGAPIILRLADRSPLHTALTTPGAGAECKWNQNPCRLAANAGPIEITVDDGDAHYRFQLDLPDTGAEIKVSKDMVARNEALETLVASTALGVALIGFGIGAHVKPVTILGGVYTGFSAIALTAVFFSAPPPPSVAAYSAQGKPIPVRAVGVSGAF